MKNIIFYRIFHFKRFRIFLSMSMSDNRGGVLSYYVREERYRQQSRHCPISSNEFLKPLTKDTGRESTGVKILW